MRFSEIKWVIQKTLTSKNTINELTAAIIQTGAYHELIDIVPFNLNIEYDSKDDKFPIVYGSTTLMLGSYNHPYLKQGVFYNPETFTMLTYWQYWCTHMLNMRTEIRKISEIHEFKWELENQFFVRPNDDSKSFSGMICDYNELLYRFSNIDDTNPFLNEDTIVLISPVLEIEREWRSFIVNKKVISIVRYRLNGETSISSSDSSASLIAFIERRCQEFTPHNIFVMDVALYQGVYKIIECNCFNGTGIYGHDWNKIVSSIQNFIIHGV